MAHASYVAHPDALRPAPASGWEPWASPFQGREPDLTDGSSEVDGAWSVSWSESDSATAMDPWPRWRRTPDLSDLDSAAAMDTH